MDWNKYRRRKSRKTAGRERSGYSPFGTTLTMGHAVVVAGRTETGMVKILDSFDQTSYKMSIEEILECWGGEVITRWQIEIQ